MRRPEGRQSAERQRDDEDAAVVLTIVAALAASTAASAGDSTTPAAPAVWADPGHRFGLTRPSAAGWWASGMPR
jgi:hypothetical protein